MGVVPGGILSSGMLEQLQGWRFQWHFECRGVSSDSLLEDGEILKGALLYLKGICVSFFFFALLLSLSCRWLFGKLC